MSPRSTLGWRLDSTRHAKTWDSGMGAEAFGGRWNSIGTKAVYASLDPSTAILEVAVHKGFGALDLTPHVLTSFRIKDPTDIHLLDTANIPDSAWLLPGTPGAGQQALGDSLLKAYRFVAIPSVVSPHALNVVFSPVNAKGRYVMEMQEAFVLDARLNPRKL